MYLDLELVNNSVIDFLYAFFIYNFDENPMTSLPVGKIDNGEMFLGMIFDSSFRLALYEVGE